MISSFRILSAGRSLREAHDAYCEAQRIATAFQNECTERYSPACREALRFKYHALMDLYFDAFASARDVTRE